MRKIGKILGRSNLSIMQSNLKFLLNFRHDYSYGIKTHWSDSCNNVVVFIIDGKTIHGGLSDRLRGLLSVYHYCLKRNKKLIINWTYPFNLSDYLIVNTEKADYGGYLSHNLKEVAFRFFNSYSFMNNDEKTYFKLLDTNKPITHVYSNVTLHEELYCEYFNELFAPTEALQKAINNCLREIGGKYISITFRFIGLLGDFNDTYSIGFKLTEEQKNDYIEHCINAINKLHQKYDDVSKILVTADSNLFLSHLKSIPYVYVVPGVVSHMDGGTTLSQLKPFLDFFMISKAECCYSYQYGKMFSGTKFARTAATIGGKKVIYINDSL